MKDTRFIELVNLYIDRQISPEEHAELELEIQSHPARRQVYRQYCRMHRATKLVYESFRVNAEDGGTAVTGQPASIARIEDRLRRRRARWVYAAGSLAAAACLAVVFARVNFSPGGNVAELSAARTTPAAPAVAVAAPPPAAPSAAAESRAGLASLRHSVFAEADYAAVLATLRQEQERLLNAQLPARLSLFEDGVFDDRAALPGRGQNSLNSRRPQRTNTEFTAFQFQR
ncbi:MAG: hypothetical protein C0518_07350 [Opitutus sp.]|nr:hypothetical protein [Opitutus sp.]